MRTANDLRALAGKYATERRIPAATVIKEILHYEILFALNQSGAATPNSRSKVVLLCACATKEPATPKTWILPVAPISDRNQWWPSLICFNEKSRKRMA